MSTILEQNQASTTIHSWRHRDKYGRICTAVKVGGRTVAMMVTLPRAYTEQHPGEKYLVNDWTQPEWIDGAHNDGKVSYWPTRRAAVDKANAIALAAGGTLAAE